MIYGSATFPLKIEGKTVKYPILIEVQGYEVEKARAVRLSLRGGHGNSLLSVYQTFLSFFSEWSMNGISSFKIKWSYIFRMYVFG